jgi:hypothetical protein
MTGSRVTSLEDLDGRPWTLTSRSMRALAYYLGRGDQPLEVAVAEASGRPANNDVRAAWRHRHGGKVSPLLLIVRYGSGANRRTSVCGPAGDEPPVIADLEPSQIDRMALAALVEPDRHSAIRFLAAAMDELDSDLPGLRNEGMLAAHQLRQGVPSRRDWSRACEMGVPLLSESGQELVRALGFAVEPRGASTFVLRVAGAARGVALFLQENESPEVITARFGGTTPASYGIATADAEDLPYVLVTRGRHIRLYSARKDGGVGRKGRSETYIEANLALLPADRAGYLPLLFGADALRTGGTFDEILEASRDYAADLGGRLRERVYNEVVPGLARALAARWHGTGEPSIRDLRDIYRQTLYVVFRLLFVAYAEDKDLVPYRTNDRYRARSLKTLARELADAAERGHLQYDSASVDLWERARALWNAIDRGNRGWDVPEYNGGLFSSDPASSEVGASLAGVTLNDAEFGPPLLSLLVDSTGERMHAPVDFRSLSVREFGTIYEGLLESEVSVAGTDLDLDREGNYVPAAGGREPIVQAGTIYLHNRSGARKASGSYFTKPFVVERVLRDSLDPALFSHIARLEALVSAGREVDAAEAFFDFRCADIAMGSGHFLVAAVDHIEAGLASFLARNPLPAVVGELERLRQRALEALGPLAASVEIETSGLLRRQVARRCVYGVDVNEVAVELARLSLWIHTFVPGLPLSLLNHNLVVGNSLTGIATLDETVAILDPGDTPLRDRKGRPAGAQMNLVRQLILQTLDEAKKALGRLARTSDADAGELAAAKAALRDAESASRPAAKLMDLALAVRLGEERLPDTSSLADIDRLPEQTRRVAKELEALHFPIAFPEVLVRDEPGFDCIVGNPPWDKVRFEPQQFWVARSPGLNSLTEAEREAQIDNLRRDRPTDADTEVVERAQRERLQGLIDRAFDLQGRGQHGHHDFAKLFTERALRLLRDGGRLGYVLPRTSLVLGGWADLRRALIHGRDVRALQSRNRAGWLFDDVHGQLMVVMASSGPVSRDGLPGVHIAPAITSASALADADASSGIFLSELELAELTDTWVVPWFTSANDRGVFDAMRRHPRLGRDDGWISALADSSRWDFSGSGPHRGLVSNRPTPHGWSVLMTRHVVQFGIDVGPGFRRFVANPSQLVPLRLGVIQAARQGPVVGPDHPPIVFRYPTMNDNSRTLLATALPEQGYIYSKGYVHGLRIPATHTPADVLALLGFLNSFTADWWVRRFTDRHMTLPILKNLPLPDWAPVVRTEVAELVETLLVRGGTKSMARKSTLVESNHFADASDTDLKVKLERVVLAGFGLGEEHLQTILSDFSAEGCPAPLRKALLATHHQGRAAPSGDV